MKRSYLFIVFSIFVMAACSANGGAGSDSHTSVSVSMKIPASENVLAVEKPVSEGVQSVEARVINSAGSPADDPEKKDVEANDVVVFDFEVPLGQMTFIVEAFSEKDSQGILLFRGETTENIIASSNSPIQIIMQRVTETEAIPVTPRMADVSLLGTIGFTADTSGLVDPTLEWQVEGIENGNEQVGEISADGNTAFYTAPAQFPGKNSVTVKVVDISDVSKFGTATVNLQNPNFTISPRAAIVEKTGSQVFSLSGIDLSDVLWEVNGVPGGNSELGTIDGAGTYVGPRMIPIDGPDEGSTPLGVPKMIAVEATSQTQPPSMDIATVKVVTGSTLTFGANQQVTPVDTGTSGTSTRSSGQRNIVFYEGKVTVVWIKSLGERTAVFSESEDGKNWTTPVPILDIGPDHQADPAIAVDSNGTIYVAFSECAACPPEFQKIRLAVKRLGETAFSEIQLVMAGTNPIDPSVAVSPVDDTVFVAWAANQGQGAGFDILLQRIDSDGSLIDQTPKNLTAAAGDMAQTQAVLSVAEDGTVFIAWIEAGVLFASASRDKGETFRPPVVVSEGLLSSDRSTIAAGPLADNGVSRHVYLAWEGIASTASQNPIVYFNKGTLGASGAIVFETAEPVGSFSAVMNRQVSPSLAWDGSNGVYLAVHEVFSGFDVAGLFLSKRFDDDSSFSSFEKIDDDVGNRHGKQYPSIAVDNAGRTFAAWTDIRGGISPNYVWFAKGE